MSTQAGTTNDFEAKVRRFAGAIAYAEGFWDLEMQVRAGSRPARANNPGDLEGKNWPDQTGNDGPYAVFASLAAGWAALYGMVRRDLSGKSSTYSPDMTISDYAWTYTATEQDAWSENVSAFLGISRDTRISDWLGRA